MVKNSNSFRFDGRIRDFERTILDYQFEIFGYSSLSDTMGVILAYLSLYGELTQGQLKKLTNFSKSTISTSLSTLINIGYVRKEKIRHSREYKYYKKRRSQESIDFALGTMENEIAFFNEKIVELENKSLAIYNATVLSLPPEIATPIFALFSVFPCFFTSFFTLFSKY